jgi:hypothetical protein
MSLTKTNVAIFRNMSENRWTMLTAVDTFQIQYQPTLADFMSAYKLQVKRSIVSRLFHYVNPILGGLLMFTAILPPLVHTGPWRNAVVPFGIGLFVTFGVKLWLRARYSRDPRLGEQFTTTFGPEGFVVEGSTSKMEFRWSGVTEMRENKDVLLIGFGPCQSDIMPKRAFSEPQLEEVRRLAHSQRTKK